MRRSTKVLNALWKFLQKLLYIIVTLVGTIVAYIIAIDFLLGINLLLIVFTPLISIIIFTYLIRFFMLRRKEIKGFICAFCGNYTNSSTNSFKSFKLDI